MKLVPYCMKKIKIPSDPAIDYEDMIQEGYAALWEVCKLYDESKGNFATYAVPFIVGRLKSSIYKNATIRLSNNYYKVKSAIIRQNYELPLSEEEKEVISKEVGVSKRYLDKYTLVVVNSLDTPISDEEDSVSLADLIPDNSSYIEMKYTDDQIEELVDKIISLALTNNTHQKARDITEEWLYMELSGEHYNLQELSKLYKVSRQYVYSIVSKAKYNLMLRKRKVYELLGI